MTFQNPITTEQFDKAVQIGAVSWVSSEEMALEDVRRALSLYNTTKANELYEEFGGEPSSAGYANGFEELEDLPLTSSVEGDYITSELRAIGYRTQIAGKFLRYGKYEKLKKALINRNMQLFRRMGLDATHKFTFALDSAMTALDGKNINLYGGDAASLVNDAHVMNNGQSYDNQLVASGDTAGRLSESTWEDAQDMASDFFDHAGNLITANLDTIVTSHHSGTRATATRLKNQGGQVTIDRTNDNVLNTLNPYAGTFNHIVMPLLATNAAGGRDSSKNRWWAGIDSRIAKDNLQCRVGLAPMAFEPVLAENKDSVTYKGMAEYDMLHVGSEFIVMSPAG